MSNDDEDDNLEKFTRLMRVSRRIKTSQAAAVLGMTEVDLTKNIANCSCLKSWGIERHGSWGVVYRPPQESFDAPRGDDDVESENAGRFTQFLHAVHDAFTSHDIKVEIGKGFIVVPLRHPLMSDELAKTWDTTPAEEAGVVSPIVMVEQKESLAARGFYILHVPRKIHSEDSLGSCSAVGIEGINRRGIE